RKHSALVTDDLEIRGGSNPTCVGVCPFNMSESVEPAQPAPGFGCGHGSGSTKRRPRGRACMHMTCLKIDPYPCVESRKRVKVFFLFCRKCVSLLSSPVANSPLGYSSGTRLWCAHHVPCAHFVFLGGTEFALFGDAGFVLSRVCGFPLLPFLMCQISSLVAMISSRSSDIPILTV
ncbi:unnamed protein product, partial [Ectocarpus sp. 4 AP-2014]